MRIYLVRKEKGKQYNVIRLASTGGRRVEFLDGIRGRWKLGAYGNSRTHDAQLVFFIRLAPPLSALCVATHSFGATPTYAWCARTQALSPLFNWSHMRVRTRTRVFTLTHATDKVPPPTAVHPIASRFLSRTAPPCTSLYLS